MREKDIKLENKFLKACLFLEKDKTKNLQCELKKALSEFERVNAELEAVYRSKRWRVTEPLAKLNKIRSVVRHPYVEQKSSPQLPDFDTAIFSNGKKTIFVIDDSIPRYDKDAGSRSIYGYLRMFVKMGLNVIFMGADFKTVRPYAQELEKQGIIVVHGIYYSEHWEDWIKTYGKNISFVLLNRPYVAYHFMDCWKENTGAKIIYMGCDLHFLRQRRQYEVEQSETLLEAIKEAEAIEYVVMYEADTVMMFSEVEKRIIKKEFGIDVVTVPLYYFKDLQKPERDIKTTCDLIFVGGFKHLPNVDAVKWFIEEIWPIVKKQLPDIKFYIVGSNPPQEIKDFASDDIIVTGFVTDEQLENYYRSCRVCVLPLRFGAGVKGKTLEAMKTGIPIVSTSIGIEGMQAVETVLSPCDQAGEFAQQIIDIYQDDERISECPEKYTEYLRKYFSYEKTEEIFKNVFES